MVDVNGLRVFNYDFGYFAGNNLIQILGKMLVHVGLATYHRGGGMFLCKGDSHEELTTQLMKAQQLLKHSRIEFCFGVGTNLDEAERDFYRQKKLQTG